jgi:hypothetical protein
MVNQVVPRDELDSAVMTLASTIAAQDAFALRMAKRAVNQTLDIQGFTAAVQSIFDVHQLGHGHALTESGYPVMIGLDAMKTEVAQRK